MKPPLRSVDLQQKYQIKIFKNSEFYHKNLKLFLENNKKYKTSIQENYNFLKNYNFYYFEENSNV